MEYQTPAPSNDALLGQVRRIDLKIRSKWTDMYRANIPKDTTFTRCIRKAEATADNMWGADFTRDTEPRSGPDLRNGRERVAASKKEKVAGKCKTARGTKVKK